MIFIVCKNKTEVDQHSKLLSAIDGKVDSFSSRGAKWHCFCVGAQINGQRADFIFVTKAAKSDMTDDPKIRNWFQTDVMRRLNPTGKLTYL